MNTILRLTQPALFYVLACSSMHGQLIAWSNGVLIIGGRDLLMNHPYLISLWMWSGRCFWTVLSNAFVFVFFFFFNEAWLAFKKKKKISCVVQYFFSLHSLSRWIQLLLPMYDGLCIFGMDKSTSSPRSGPSYSYPDSLTDHNAICYSSWDHISLSSFFLIYPVYHIYIYIYIYIYMCVCVIAPFLLLQILKHNYSMNIL